MWTEEHRAIYRRDGKGFPSDLRDAEWVRLEPLIPRASPGGRPRKTHMRAAVNAIFYPARHGVIKHLSQVPTRGNRGGDLGRGARGVAGTDGPRGQPLGRRSRQPIAEIGGKGGGKDDAVGYDAGKKVKGRKIHALVDTEGLPMRIVVHSAAIQDRDGAGLVLDKIRRRFPWLELIWADGGYNAWQVEAAVAKVPVLRMEIVKRSDDMKGFIVLPRRWVVERTFSWFGRNRRLAKDFENLAETLATFVTLACIQLAVRRLARL